MNEQSRDQKMDSARLRLAELAERFLVRSHGDIASMRSGLDRLDSGDAGGLDDIRHFSHRMVGTGATLGFTAISDLAHRLEALAESCPAGLLPDETMRGSLREALQALEAELRDSAEARG